MTKGTTDLAIQEDVITQIKSLQSQTSAFPEGEKPVSTNSLTKLSEGENKFWLIGKPIHGSETWFRRIKVDPTTAEVKNDLNGQPQKESRVIRQPKDTFLSIPENLKDWQKDRAKPFIACFVFNFTTGKKELFISSVMSIYNGLFNHFKGGEDKPNPYKCGFIITKTKKPERQMIGGVMQDVYDYTVSASKELDEIPAMVLQSLKGISKLPELELLYEGVDPLTEIPYYDDLQEGEPIAEASYEEQQ